MTDTLGALSQVTVAHADVLAALHQTSFPHPWPLQAFVDLLALPSVTGWITGAPDPDGFILVQSAAEETEILTLAVVPSRRRRGLGRDLVAYALSQLRTAGTKICHLEVAAHNEAARALYGGLGFKVTGQRTGYCRHASLQGESNAEDAVVMSLALENA